MVAVQILENAILVFQPPIVRPLGRRRGVCNGGKTAAGWCWGGGRRASRSGARRGWEDAGGERGHSLR